ncbi:MAG: CopG family transcriptional regulator [Spirochaetes bacterium]|nr:MAG: CopG family transcriptional regulator [Spirochaetota bacterium]
MKRKLDYTKAPKSVSLAIRESRVIADFLPAPEMLVKKEESVKVTILLSKASVNFFKSRAKMNGVPYQVMIKAVLDRYSEHYRDGK